MTGPVPRKWIRHGDPWPKPEYATTAVPIAQDADDRITTNVGLSERALGVLHQLILGDAFYILGPDGNLPDVIVELMWAGIPLTRDIYRTIGGRHTAVLVQMELRPFDYLVTMVREFPDAPLQLGRKR